MHQPGACLNPIAPHRALVRAQRIGGFLITVAREKAAFHHTRQTEVECGQPAKRIVDVYQQRIVGRLGRNIVVFERQGHRPATPLRRHLPSGVVDEDVPHRQSGSAQEVIAVGEAARILQLQVSLVYQHSSLQCIATRVPALPARQTMKIVVQQRQQRAGREYDVGLLTGLNKIADRLRHVVRSRDGGDDRLKAHRILPHPGKDYQPAFAAPPHGFRRAPE